MPTIESGGMRLERSRAGERDLDEILIYSSYRFGEVIADEYLFSFNAVFELLMNHPFAGVAIDDVDPGVRKLAHRRHRIFYEIDDDRTFVLRVLHHARDVTGLLRQ